MVITIGSAEFIVNRFKRGYNLGGAVEEGAVRFFVPKGEGFFKLFEFFLLAVKLLVSRNDLAKSLCPFRFFLGFNRLSRLV